MMRFYPTSLGTTKVIRQVHAQRPSLKLKVNSNLPQKDILVFIITSVASITKKKLYTSGKKH